MRVHSGSGPVSALSQVDRQGADVHVFTNRDNYIWNNDRGDCAALQDESESKKFDQCWYDRKPPEGIVLERVNDKFQAPAIATATANSRR